MFPDEWNHGQRKAGKKMNKEKKGTLNNRSVIDVIQSRWGDSDKKDALIDNYKTANNAWQQAFDAVNNFCGNYQYYDLSFKTLENNMLHKSTKALANAGEAYEPLHWKIQTNGQIVGPGGSSGEDLMIYYRNYKAQETGEVKSANSYSSLIARIRETMKFSTQTDRIIHYDVDIPDQYFHPDADTIILQNPYLYKISVYHKNNTFRGYLIVDIESRFLNKTDNMLYK